MNISPLNQIDFYKADHRSQYPKGTEMVFSNLTARKSRMPEVKETVFFGLQYFIKEYLQKQWNENFFAKPKQEVVAEYKRRLDNALGKGAVDVEHIAELHDLGYLPLEIMAVPEGTLVPIGVPSMVMFNTNPNFFWLTNYLETILSCSIWQAITSATIAWQYRKLLSEYAKRTVGNDDFVKFQAHDFSFRGQTSLESACMSGSGHLLSFVGTDTVPAIDFLQSYYNAIPENELVGCSVPATEHSVMCMGGQLDEMETFNRLMETYPRGILSVVSDTWDFWQVVNEFMPKLKDKILGRDGKLVIRPDSGDPVDIICGTEYLSGGESGPKAGLIESLWNIFGGTITLEGYKVLDSHIGAIYGDSITIERAKEICQRLTAKGFATTNIVLGVGSYSYQYVTRDTFGFAVKATYGEVDGQPREIFKEPKTDNGMKKSAKGLTAVFRNNDGKLYLTDQSTWDDVRNCEFKTVFKNGVLTTNHLLSDIRSRLLANL